MCAALWWCSRSHFSDSPVFLQVSEAILDNARLMLQTENIQANAEDFKDRSEVTHSTLFEPSTLWPTRAPPTSFVLQV